MGQCEPHYIECGQGQRPARGLGQPPVAGQAGNEWFESSPVEDLGVLCGGLT